MKLIFFAFTLNIFYLSHNFTYAQKLTNGVYEGVWPNWVIVADLMNDTLTIKETKSYVETLILDTPINAANKISMDGIEYSISFNSNKVPNSLLLISHSDTLELVKIIEKTSSGKVFWKTTVLRSYEDNGQPANFFIYYYDTIKTDGYPFWPTSLTNFKNDRKKNIFYLKHGIENEYCTNINGYLMIGTGRKWRNGKLKKTKYYKGD